MFPEVVLVVKKAANSGGLLIDAKSEVRHARDGFQDDGIVSGCCWIGSPGKRSMIGYQHGRDHGIVHAIKCTHDGVSGVFFVSSGDVAVRDNVGHRNCTAEISAM